MLMHKLMLKYGIIKCSIDRNIDKLSSKQLQRSQQHRNLRKSIKNKTIMLVG